MLPDETANACDENAHADQLPSTIASWISSSSARSLFPVWVVRLKFSHITDVPNVITGPIVFLVRPISTCVRCSSHRSMASSIEQFRRLPPYCKLHRAWRLENSQNAATDNHPVNVIADLFTRCSRTPTRLPIAVHFMAKPNPCNSAPACAGRSGIRHERTTSFRNSDHLLHEQIGAAARAEQRMLALVDPGFARARTKFDLPVPAKGRVQSPYLVCAGEEHDRIVACFRALRASVRVDGEISEWIARPNHAIAARPCERCCNQAPNSLNKLAMPSRSRIPAR